MMGGGDKNKVDFRLIVFRPFKGEVLTGRISSSTSNGIKVRTDFFDEISIPCQSLFEGSTLGVNKVMGRNKSGYGTTTVRTFTWTRMRL